MSHWRCITRLPNIIDCTAFGAVDLTIDDGNITEKTAFQAMVG